MTEIVLRRLPKVALTSDPHLWIPGFITGTVTWMRKRPEVIEPLARRHLAVICRLYVNQGHCLNTTLNYREGPRDKSPHTSAPNITPHQLGHFMLAMNVLRPRSLTRHITNIHAALWCVQGPKKLRHFWIPWVHFLARSAAQELLRTPGVSALATAVLFLFACKHLGPPPPAVPDDLGWPVTIRDRMPEFWQFLADPERREARFRWNSMQRQAMRLSKLLPKLETSLDTSTKPPTTVLRKRSRADPEHHTAWAKRKEEVREEFEIFEFCNREFLKSLTGEFYDRLVNFPDLEAPDLPVPEGTLRFGLNDPAGLDRTTQDIRDRIANAQLALPREPPFAGGEQQLGNAQRPTPVANETPAASAMVAGPSKAARSSTPHSTLSQPGEEEVAAQESPSVAHVGRVSQAGKRKAAAVEGKSSRPQPDVSNSIASRIKRRRSR
jgi:hypothetical protein